MHLFCFGVDSHQRPTTRALVVCWARECARRLFATRQLPQRSPCSTGAGDTSRMYLARALVNALAGKKRSVSRTGSLNLRPNRIEVVSVLPSKRPLDAVCPTLWLIYPSHGWSFLGSNGGEALASSSAVKSDAGTWICTSISDIAELVLPRRVFQGLASPHAKRCILTCRNCQRLEPFTFDSGKHRQPRRVLWHLLIVTQRLKRSASQSE